MHLSTRLDCDLVAVESADELTLLVEVTAPAPATTTVRQPATLQVVLDRSGSMAGDRLEGAKAALIALVDRLDPADNLGVVAFDDQVQIVVPAGLLTNKAAVKQAIAEVDAGGSTDLSAGYLRGLQEARRVSGPAGATLLLVSDGHANAGVVDPVALGKVAAEAHTHRITTSTVGFGLGYDERLLAALAQGGAGNELFAEQADTAIALISGEVDGLLTQVSQAASLRVRWTPDVASASIMNDLSCTALPDGFVVELGSFYAGESRRLLIKLQIPGIAALGLAEVAVLELTHVSLPDLVQHTATLPVEVNVVPGDQAAGRLRDPQVHSEALFQQSQQAKRRSSKLLSEGHVQEASALLHQTSLDLDAWAGSMPDQYGAELTREAQLMSALADEAEVDSARAAKVSSTSATMSSRNRGRQSRGGRFQLHWVSGSEVLVLDEWELVRLERMAPSATTIRAAVGNTVVPHVATMIVDELDADHPHRPFFAGAVEHDGFTVERA